MVADRHGCCSRERIRSSTFLSRLEKVSVVEPSVEERNRRAVDKTEGNEQQAASAREFVVKVEDELQKDGILVFTDKSLIPLATAGKSKVLYYRTKNNFCRHPAEFARGDAKSKAVEDARVACAEATKIDEKDSIGTQPVHLDLASNLSVLQYQVLRSPDEACKMAHVASEKVQKTVEVQQVQYVDEIIDEPFVAQHQVPTLSNRAENGGSAASSIS